MNVLKDLSTREKQVYGAFCLHRFCEAKGIEHACITELIEHLLSIQISFPLDGWERKGAALDLSGRGDPIPDALEPLIADDVREDFVRLVDFVVEIGIADMYGAPTMEPMNYLLRCLAILDANGIERPEVAELFMDRTAKEEDSGPHWGETISQERYEQLMALFH